MQNANIESTKHVAETSVAICHTERDGVRAGIDTVGSGANQPIRLGSAIRAVTQPAVPRAMGRGAMGRKYQVIQMVGGAAEVYRQSGTKEECLRIAAGLTRLGIRAWCIPLAAPESVGNSPSHRDFTRRQIGKGAA